MPRTRSAQAPTVSAASMALLDEHEAAEFLRMSVHSLRRWRYDGGGPRFAKIGARVLYDRNDLAEFVQARKTA